MDFAMFHTLAHLASRAMEFYTYFKLPDGTERRKLIPGPQNKDQWGPCFDLFVTAAIMLDLVEDYALEDYKFLMNGYMTRFARDCWHLCYAADLKARTMCLDQLYWDTLHKIKDGKPAPEFWDEGKPWTAMFVMLCNDITFWQKKTPRRGRGLALFWPLRAATHP